MAGARHGVCQLALTLQFHIHVMPHITWRLHSRKTLRKYRIHQGHNNMYSSETRSALTTATQIRQLIKEKLQHIQHKNENQ